MSVFKKQRMEVVGEKMFNVAIRLGFCFSRKKKKKLRANLYSYILFDAAYAQHVTFGWHA
jgi:hypothetical protein